MHYLEIVVAVLNVLGVIVAIGFIVFTLFCFGLSFWRQNRRWEMSRRWRYFWWVATLPILVLGIPGIVVWLGG